MSEGAAQGMAAGTAEGTEAAIDAIRRAAEGVNRPAEAPRPSRSEPARVEARRRAQEALVGAAVVGVDRLPMLDVVIDRLAGLMATSLRNFLGDNAEVSIARTRPMRLKTFLDALAQPAMVAVLRAEQWDGCCLAALDPALVTALVEILLGGRRARVQPVEDLPIEDRPYTPIERGIVQRLVQDVIAPELGRAFASVCDVSFRFERIETTPGYAAVTKPSAAAVTFRAELTLAGRCGLIEFLLPYVVLEPAREILSQEFMGRREQGDAIWRAHLLAELPRAEIMLRAVIGQREMSAGAVACWRPGTVLALDRRHDTPIEVLCEDLPVLRARIAEKDGRVALYLVERCLAEDWPFPTGATEKPDPSCSSSPSTAQD
jgi:flagellar motor switch protein FliM